MTTKKHVIAGALMKMPWVCDGHQKSHEIGRWGYFAMPIIVEAGDTAKVFCGKKIKELEVYVQKKNEELDKQSKEAPKQPEVVADSSGLLEVSGGTVHKASDVPDKSQIILPFVPKRIYEPEPVERGSSATP